MADLFSGKIKCQVKQVYTGDPIIDQIPMADDPDPDMFSCPEWLKDHNQAILETHALGLYAESIKKGICDLPGCFCHELAAMKNQEEKEDELSLTKIPISDINMNLETRFRQNLGDLKPLIESIKRHGLLHPIVLSEDNQLICGRRRVAACMQLDLKEIEVTYTNSTDLREAEADENNETFGRISLSKRLQKLMNSL